MPIGNISVYNPGDLILQSVSSSGNTFQENKIAAATSSIILFNASGNLTSQSLNNTTVGTSSYLSGSNIIVSNITASNISASGNITATGFSGSNFGTSSWSTNSLTSSYLTTTNSYTVTNLTASNISASATGSFGIVGIGTSSPAYSLDVTGTGRFTNTLLVSGSTTIKNILYVGNNSETVIGSSTVDSSTRGNIYYNGTDAMYNIVGIPNVGLAFGTGGTGSRVVIDSTGNVGIGTTSPNTSLDVRRNSSGYVFRAASNVPTAGLMGSFERQNGSGVATGATRFGFTNNISEIQSLTGFAFFINGTSDLNSQANGTQSLTILSTSGKVGIGTTSPSQLLDISGSFNSYGGWVLSGNPGGPVGVGITNSAATRYIGAGGSTTNFYHNVPTGGTFRFNINESEKVQIDSSGKVGINTTSPVSTLTVVSSGSAFESTNAMVAYFGRNTANGYGSTFIRVARYSGTTSTGSNSDYTDIEYNSAGSGPFRYGTYGDTNIINSGIPANGVYGSINFVTSGSTRMTIAGGTAAGYVGIGTSSPTARLSLTASTTSVGGIAFGTDANLYRSAASTLKTDGSLVVLNTIYVSDNTGISNVSTENNSFLRMNTAGSLLTRNINDSSPAFIIQQVHSGSTGDIVQLKNSASTVFTVQQTGNVGIGTSSPSAILEVSSSTASTIFNVKGAGGANLFTVSGSGNIGVGTTPSNSYKMQINGSFSATTKSFDIDHPVKSGKRLVYGSLESPYHGVRLTGKGKLVKGKGVIQLPDYMNKLVDYDNPNVQITNIKHNKVIYVDGIDEKNNIINIATKIPKTQLNKELEFYWTFTAVRKDVPPLQVEC